VFAPKSNPGSKEYLMRCLIPSRLQDITKLSEFWARFRGKE
jgi:hypothetical protein